jgi:hypothetical protein
MKRHALVLVLALAAVAAAVGENLFVTSRVCPILAEESAAAKRLGVLKQDDELIVLRAGAEWTRVKTAEGLEGYVQNVFVGSERAMQKVSGQDLQNISTVVTRRRASAYTTSAAAARGLAGEDVRERENLSFKAYDFSSGEWLARFTYTEEEILSFARNEGIGF